MMRTQPGLLSKMAGNGNAIHPAIAQLKGHWCFFSHNGVLQNGGGSYSCGVGVDSLYCNDDGTLKRVIQTTKGVNPVE